MIHILPPETAKRIAAGEVIERPASALRELLDNALDAGAKNIVVELLGGGIDQLLVVDDGHGMDREDLALSIQAHATSKIFSVDDLLSLKSLGFRGEALSSMAAVAELEITSSRADGEAWRIRSLPNGKTEIERCQGSVGTRVVLKNLFAEFPARRRFLKRPASETLACRQVLLDKALAFPECSFRLFSDGKPILILLANDLVSRITDIAPKEADRVFIKKLKAEGEGFELELILGSPELFRTDKKYIQVFVNRRRIFEYSLNQALEYAYQPFLPGGSWPYAWLFARIDPSLVDFNIHPAKREARIRNLGEVRDAIIRQVRAWLSGRELSSAASSHFSPSSMPFQEKVLFDSERQAQPDFEYPASQSPGQPAFSVQDRQEPLPFRYLGQALGVFLVCEFHEELRLLDMHAAHERIIYDRICSGPIERQELLVPVVREPESDEEDEWLRANQEALLKAGFRTEQEGKSWLLYSVPAIIPTSGTGAFFELVNEKPDAGELFKAAAARTACRSALMEGHHIDDTAAIQLVREALALPVQKCPHGRPIWISMSRESLYKAVMRNL